MEENARAYAENGHNAAILGKKSKIHCLRLRKAKRMLVKMDIIELPCVKNPKPLQE